MGLNKRLIGGAAGGAIPVNTDNFDVVTYTGTGSTYNVGDGVDASVTLNYGSANWAYGSASYGNNSGKHYFEVKYISANGASRTLMVGIINTAYGESWTNAQTKMYYSSNGNKYTGGSGTSYGSVYYPGDVIGVAYDGTARTVTFYKNGVSQGTAFTGLITNYPSYYPAIGTGLYSETAQFRFTSSEFTYSPPSGYSEWGSTTVSAVGGTVNSAVAGQPIDFQPDLVWIKSRSTATNNELHDSLRGEPSRLFSDATNTEMTVDNGFVSLDSNGFSLDGAGGGGEVNTSGRTYVAWCWKAGGTAVSNTDGDITSTVSANQDAGFSIVKYTGNSSYGQTVGHGLSSAPELVIIKNLDNARNWRTYAEPLGATKYINLDETAAAGTYGSFNNTAPTTTVFSTTSSVADRATNYSGDRFIAYCFHSVDGYQKVGYYTSNASVKITTGFEPRWIMQKYTGVANNWWIMDTHRYGGETGTHGGKLVKPYLIANDLASESAGPAGGSVEFVEDGFYPTNFFNSNGVIYLAIA